MPLEEVIEELRRNTETLRRADEFETKLYARLVELKGVNACG